MMKLAYNSTQYPTSTFMFHNFILTSLVSHRIFIRCIYNALKTPENVYTYIPPHDSIPNGWRLATKKDFKDAKIRKYLKSVSDATGMGTIDFCIENNLKVLHFEKSLDIMSHPFRPLLMLLTTMKMKMKIFMMKMEMVEMSCMMSFMRTVKSIDWID